ncbi:alpha/beta-hydrolase [Apiospora hydei]|uniref:Alpha/beta-hydrolase n=1 Tax=Apiospora hydei TaxID=1337664 RepID=A0ABR1V3L9_9PEZI
MGAPSIIAIPGASGLPKHLQPVVDAIAKSGEVRPGPPPTLQDDAAFITKHIASLADAGRDVLLIAHSYAGAPASEAVKGWSKTSRQEQGLEGGVIRIAYMTSLVPALGQAPGSILAEVPAENQIATEIDENGWMHYTDFSKMAERSFSKFPPEEGLVWAHTLVRHSAASFASPLTYAGYKDVPVSYLFCEDDHLIPPFVQQKRIDMIERETGKKVDVTRIDSDHVPTISRTELVIDWIIKLVETK